MTSRASQRSDHVPDNESARIAAVRRYEILDTPPDGSFDRITAIAARLFNVPISIISIVDHDRIWFKSHHGVETDQIGRDPGLCASAILRDGPHIVPDTKLDVHALTNPLVSGTLGLRFYAGVPLHTHDGFNLGTLCVIDKEPRVVTAQQIEDLKDLASVVMDQLELRLSARSALTAKDTLLNEINHRIGNNLQSVSDYLQLEGLHTDSIVTAQLNESAGRVARIGRVHHRLSQSGQREAMDIKPYLEELCNDISSSLSFDQKGRGLVVDVVSAELPASTITILGLIINELVMNSAKHAFGPTDTGAIEVTLQETGTHYSLTVSDDGRVALPATENLRSGVGTNLIRSLVGQIRGEIQSGPAGENGGWSTTIRFDI